DVHLALFFWGLDQGAEALRTARDVIPALPDATGAMIAVALNAPPAPFVPAQYHFAPGHALIVVGFGTAEEHVQAIAPIRTACPPLFEFVTPIPYTQLQQMLDESAPWGIRAYEKGLYLDDLSDDAIGVLVGRAADKTSPMSFAPIFNLDGAYCRVRDEDTAYGGRRRPQYVVNIAAVSPDTEALDADRAWVRSLWDALRPLAGDAGGYVNFMADQDDDRVRASYGAKYDRLARIKAQYDPGNVLRRNVNIKPAESRT
ncbi:MAG: BBE domain-containing protein, partial [Solirubrobacteraceae bacterium]